MKLSKMMVAALGVAVIPMSVSARVTPTERQMASQAGQTNAPPTVQQPMARIAIINTGAFSTDDGITQLNAQLRRVAEQFRERTTRLESLKQRAETLAAELDRQGSNLTPVARASKQEELEEVKLNGQVEGQKLDRDSRKAMQEGTDPVLERIRTALDAYCKERNIVMVLEVGVLSQANAIPYVDPSLDITRDFIATYNKTAAPAPKQP